MLNVSAEKQNKKKMHFVSGKMTQYNKKKTKKHRKTQ